MFDKSSDSRRGERAAAGERAAGRASAGELAEALLAQVPPAPSTYDQVMASLPPDHPNPSVVRSDGAGGAWVDVLDQPPGPGLLTELIDAHPAGLGDLDLLAVLGAWERAASWVAARHGEALGALLGRAGRLGGLGQVATILATEVGYTQRAAQDKLAFAHTLGTFPQVAHALETGAVDVAKAKTICDEALNAPDESAQQVAALGLALAPRKTPPPLRRALRAAIVGLDPAAATKRAQHARTQRRVEFHPLPDAMALISAYLPAADAMAVKTALDALARTTATEDPRTFDQRRADYLAAIFHAICDTNHAPLAHASGDHTPHPPPTPASAGDAEASSEARASTGHAGANAGASGAAGATAASSEADASTGAGAAEAGSEARASTGHAGANAGASGAAGAAEASSEAGAAEAGSEARATSREAGANAGASGAAGAGSEADASTGHATCCGQAHRPGEVLWRRLATSQRQRPHLQVTIADTTLLGLDERPGELTGYGPIPADVARHLATDATWRALYTDQAGTITAVGERTYRPGTVLTRHVTARDRTCTFTGCTRPATQCDIDHRTPYDPTRPAAEQTHPGNLHALCRYHHNLKTLHGWQPDHDPHTGITTWTSPLGTTRQRDPEPPLPPWETWLETLARHQPTSPCPCNLTTQGTEHDRQPADRQPPGRTGDPPEPEPPPPF